MSCTTVSRVSHESSAGAVDRISVAVVGASGFTGALVAELLLRHPGVELVQLSSEQLAGAPVAAHLPRLRTELVFCAPAEVGGVDLALVCAPHGQAAHVVRRLLDGGARVVDLSADFRLDAETYAAWYGPHPCPELLPGAVYGLTELHRPAIAGAALVANPGCYPTAALLALTPLLSLGLTDVVIDAKSGVSGAGKAATPRTHFCTVDCDFIAYALAGHRHYPEIVAGLAAASAATSTAAGTSPADGAAGAASPVPTVTFVPHLMPVQRGIVETLYVRTEHLPAAGELRRLLETAYAAEPFVDVCDQPPELKDVVGTNRCRLFATLDERAARIVVVAAIDNLMKGAAGQAVQNLNVMAGFAEDRGLS
ncbi:MAG TPA: N-acetyl-gamma-glutamyl-phosphate reductase [Thermoleophilia bacterium]|nr:N-acetyl-gamma-glutamyl-phosphate reductase [Thermoleophilia bacterium]